MCIRDSSKKCPLLNRLKEKLARQIDSVKELDDITRYDLQTRLDGMPKHLKLCHGDFEPVSYTHLDVYKRQVLYGYGSREELEKAGAEELAKSVKDLQELLLEED